MKLTPSTIALAAVVVGAGAWWWWSRRSAAIALKAPAPATGALAATPDPWASVAIAGINQLGSYLNDSKPLR